MTDKRFIVAKNPDPDSSLPYLVRLPVGTDGLVLKARETWPRTAKVYCHRAAEGEWHDGLEIVEDVGVRSCVRKGVAVDLVLDRGKEHRSQFVFTRMKGGREGIFWQSAKTTKKARPSVRVRAEELRFCRTSRSQSTPGSATRTSSPSSKQPPSARNCQSATTA